MDEHLNTNNIYPEEIRDFIEKIAGISGSHFIFKHGYNYVDSVKYWQWMKESYPKVFKEGLQNWLDRHPIYGAKLIQGKGMEWDWAKSFNNNPINQGFHLPPEQWKIAKLSKDTTSKTDATIRHLLSGNEELVQVKTATTNNSVRSVANTLESKYPGHKIVANEKLASEAKKIGIPNQIDSVPDKQLAKSTQKRVDMAKSGGVSAGYTIPGVLKEMGYGAIVGAVIQASISGFTNYKLWKVGKISKDEFTKEVLNDAAYGATTGSAIAGVNVVIQTFAIPAGVGMPVTLPILILAGYGLERIIAPAFGKGAYREILQDISLSTDVQKAFIEFAVNSYGSYLYFEEWVKKMSKSHNVLKYVESINKAYNDEIEDISSKL